MTFRLWPTQNTRLKTLSAALLLGLCLPGVGHTFEKLTEAQSWIYDHSHLSNTSDGQVLEYQYTGSDKHQATVEDVARLSITNTADKERKDVVVDFLTEERHLALPPFSGYRGNPIIIAMLEHIAQSMGTETGGGVLYFRNRIRDSLASDNIKVETSESVYREQTVDTTTLRFQPFLNDEYLKNNPVLSQAEFAISFSDDVPAGLLSVSVTASSTDQKFERQLALK